MTNTILKAIRPDPRPSYPKWANENIVLSSVSSSIAGSYRIERTPYAIPILETLSFHHPSTEVVWVKGTQIGGTVLTVITVLASMDMFPCPSMAVFPDKILAENYSDLKFEPLLKEIPRIVEKIISEKGELGNKLLKRYTGGVVKFTYSGSDSSKRSTSVRLLVFDDLDGFKYSTAKDGNIVSTLETRTDAFGKKKKIYKNSTPNITDFSPILEAFENTNQQFWNMPCPHCHHKFIFDFAEVPLQFKKENDIFENRKMFKLTFDYDLETFELNSEPMMICPECGCYIEEAHKTKMLINGVFIAEKKHRHEGFHISSLYSPLGLSWEDIAYQYLKSLKAIAENNDYTQMEAFVSTRLGMQWNREKNVLKSNDLILRKEKYYNTVPDGVKIITAGVDIQKDRIEIEFLGIGNGYETWSIDYVILYGIPPQADSEVWDLLYQQLTRQFAHKDGNMMVFASNIDSGNWTQVVYEFCKKHYRLRFFAVKGANTATAELSRFKAIKYPFGKYPFVLGVNKAKTMILDDFLPLTTPSAGYMHYPQKKIYNDKYFKGLTVEKKDKFGVWKNPNNRRNEPLDVRVYALCVLFICDINPSELTKPIFATPTRQKPKRRFE